MILLPYACTSSPWQCALFGLVRNIRTWCLCCTRVCWIHVPTFRCKTQTVRAHRVLLSCPFRASPVSIQPGQSTLKHLRWIMQKVQPVFSWHLLKCVGNLSFIYLFNQTCYSINTLLVALLFLPHILSLSLFPSVAFIRNTPFLRNLYDFFCLSFSYKLGWTPSFRVSSHDHDAWLDHERFCLKCLG